MKTITSKILAVVATTLIFANVATAAPLDIISTPQETTGPFIHNVFHVNNDGGPSGVITAWLSLDNSASNFYDPMTGDIQFTLDMFSGSDLSSNIGSVTGVGNIPGANFTGTNSNNIAGNIAFTFSDSTPTVNVIYRDFEYTTSTAGFTANSWDGTYLTLWGAGLFGFGQGENILQNDFAYEYLGTDLVFETRSQVPEPSTLALLFAGVFGLVLQKKKRLA